MTEKELEIMKHYIYAGKTFDEEVGGYLDSYIQISGCWRLGRFIEAQNRWYQTALEEVKAGKKVGHWIWFIFPQMLGLGKSEKSIYYGIRGRGEAIDYIRNPILRDRLVEITEAVYNNEKSVYEIFGNDAIKVRSCMLLFASVSDIPIFKKMVKKYGWK